MPNPSKTKGNRNETAICKLLSAWWESEFKRTPNSGALRWGGVTWTYGDLLPPEDFSAVVECKHYKDVDLDAVLRCKATGENILGWWEETLADAERCYQETKRVIHPVLIYKQNNRVRRMVLEASFFQAINGRLFTIPVAWITHTDHAPFVIMDLQLFLENATKAAFQKACKATLPSFLVEYL